MLVLRAGLKSSYGSLFLIGGYIFNYLEVYLVREINLILCKAGFTSETSWLSTGNAANNQDLL